MKKGREEGEKREKGGERESMSKREPNYSILLLMLRLHVTDSELSSVAYHTDGFHMSKQISYMYLNYEL